VDIFKVELPLKPTKEERETASVRFVQDTKMSKPVKITYLEREDQTTTNTDNVITVKWVKGTAIKQK
jgi:predicted restriction endonuclease